MKIKRQKKVQRILNFFKHNFGHRPPYQLLLDGTFCNACLEMKVNIKEQLPKYLGEVKLLTTQCCILELEKLLALDGKLFGACSILKQFQIHKCGHEKDPKPANKCLRSMLQDKNPNRYFIATQDPNLREKARKVPGTPVLYLHRSAPTLEKPSDMSESQANQDASDRMEESYHSKVLANLKRKELGPQTTEMKRKRKVKQPNPLSCLKSKKARSSQPIRSPDSVSKAKKKRNRKKKRDVSSNTVNK